MMKKVDGEITITITGTRIYPYRKNQCRYLENLTSISDQAFRGRRRNPITGFLLLDDDGDGKVGTFVTHLHDSEFLQNLFPNYVVRYEGESETRKLNHRFSLNDDVEPREVQYQIIQGILDHEESHQWFVYLSQGLGKTLLSVYMIPYFNTKSLIMCYNKDVLGQWYATMKKYTTIDMRTVLMIDTGALLRKIELGEFPSWEYDIFMCTPKLLTMYGSKHGYDSIDTLMRRMGIGLKIFDEAHRNIANIIKINAFTSVPKTLYLSGDFAQSGAVKQKLYYRIFHNVPLLRPTTELMNTLKYTVGIIIFFNTHPSELDRASVYTKRGFSFYEYMKYEMHQELFLHTLFYTLDFITKTNVNHYKILILVNLIEHVDVLKSEIEDRYRERYIIGRYHSEVLDAEKDFVRENCDLIVSTYQSFSTGIDVSLIKYVVSCSICTKIDDNQASGRARPLPDGSDAFYIMLNDEGFPYTKKKLRQRVAYLQETKIKDIEVIRYEE